MKIRRKNRRKKGFSLIELMVVIVILGILATVVTLKVSDYLRDARIAKAKADMQKIMQALEMYRTDGAAARGDENTEPYPTELLTLTEQNEKRPEGYISGIPKDPWGNDYVYEYDEEAKIYTIVTYGRDGEEGGEGEDGDIDGKALTGERADDQM